MDTETIKAVMIFVVCFPVSCAICWYLIERGLDMRLARRFQLLYLEDKDRMLAACEAREPIKRPYKRRNLQPKEETPAPAGMSG